MELKLLGLSEYEEKAYLALIKLGKTSASEISKEGNISYGKIYEVLASLERKGFIKTIPEKTKKFVAENPKNIAEIVKTKENELKQLGKKIAGLKQIYESQQEEVIQLVKGKNNFYKIIREMKEPKKFKYTIKYTSEFQPEWAREDEKSLKKHVDVKSLTRYDEETEKAVEKWLGIHKNIRRIENKGIAIDIRDNELMITLINNNTIMLIKDKAMIELMKILFNNTYKNAEVVK